MDPSTSSELLKRKEEEVEKKEGSVTTVEVTEIAIILNKKKGGACSCLKDYTDATASSSPPPSNNIGRRIRNGECMVTIGNLLDVDAIASIQKSAVRLASAYMSRGGNTDKNCLRMPTPEAVQRHGYHDDNQPVSLSEDLNRMVNESILEPILKYIDGSMCPSLRTELFYFPDDDHDCDPQSSALSLLELFRSDQLNYSSREPAINVYWGPGGEFGMHSDDRALTIFAALSDPGHDYHGGGGTGFWDPIQTNKVTKIYKPPAATVALWGGTVPHKGLPISSGTRAVFVASFSRKQHIEWAGDDGKGE